MPRDITLIAREYCQRSRLVRRAVVAARTRPPRRTWVDFIEQSPRERFAGEVINRLDGTILRYSMRLQLLHIGGQLGLSRFDACLIIAQVQHRATQAPPARRIQCPLSPKPRRLSRCAPYVAAGILQLCIFVAAWAVVS